MSSLDKIDDSEIVNTMMPNLDYLSKNVRRSVERTVRAVSKPAGNFIKTCNNIIDSKENIEEGVNPITRLKSALEGITVDEALATLKEGDHIKVMRSVYSHHGIYIGKGKVIHYDDFIICMSTLEDFANGDDILFVDEPSPYKRSEIVKRAKSRLGESKYNLVWNNCENFATWCRCGGE